MSRGLSVLLLSAMLLWAAPGVAQDPPAHDLLNAALWMQRSVEYKATTLGAFALARIRLDQALLEKRHQILECGALSRVGCGLQLALPQRQHIFRGEDVEGSPTRITLTADDFSPLEAAQNQRAGEFVETRFALELGKQRNLRDQIVR